MLLEEEGLPRPWYAVFSQPTLLFREMKKMMKKILVLLLSLPYAVCALSQSANPPVTLADTLTEVVVTARYVKDIISPQSLQGDRLRQLSSNSVADALRYFSGVQIKDYGGVGGLKTINVRSMGSQHVGVYYDGMQIGNAQNGTVDLGKFSMDNMEVLSLYNGQKSNTLQTAKDFSSASALYMTSRRPVFGERNYNLTFKLKGGSFDVGDFSALYEQKLSEAVSMSVNAEVLNTSGKYKFRYSKEGGYDTTEVRRNGDVFFTRAEAGIFGKTPSTDWLLKGYFYYSKRGYPGAAVKKDYEISLLNEDRQTDRNFFAQGSFTHRFSSFYHLMLKAKYAKDYMNYYMPPTSTVRSADDRYWQQEAYASASHLFSILKGWTANVATDFQWNKLEAEGSELLNANFIQPRRYTALAAASTSVSLPFGLSAQGSVLFTYVHDKGNGKTESAPDKHKFTPSLLLSYKPWTDKGWQFRAFYKKIFRLPTFNDLYYVQIGNRSLRPEYTTQYDAGFSYEWQSDHSWFRGISLTADGYYNTVTDKIIATPTSNQLVWTMLNLGYVKIHGLDVAVSPSFRFGKVDLAGRFSYTWQIARDYTDTKQDNLGDIDTYGDQIPYVPEHSATAVLSCSCQGWSFHYSFIYTGQRYMLGGNIPVNYIAPWYTHDVSASKSFQLRDVQMNVTAEVNNLFNQQYEVVKWYPMPGTNFKITLSVTI